MKNALKRARAKLTGQDTESGQGIYVGGGALLVIIIILLIVIL
ncbi:MAG: hypothetical protein ACSLFM_04065 [Tepidiformaceae bacterium]